MAKGKESDSTNKNKDTEDSYKVGSIEKFLNKIAALLKKGAVRVAVVIVSVFLVSLVFLFFTFISLNAEYVKRMDGVCVEADELSSAAKIIRSRPENDSDIIQLLSSPKYEEYSQKMRPTDINLTLNGEAIILNIAGKWTPWNMDEEIFEVPNDSYVCLLEKKLIPEGYRFSNRDEENEFYYIKNFYNDVFIKKDSDGDIIVRGISDAPERQKNCWVTRGAGLYLGVYGLNGKIQPTAYHHLISSKMICTAANWFGGAVRGLKDGEDNNYVITSYYKPNPNGGTSVKLPDMDGPLRTIYYNDDEDVLDNRSVFKKPEDSLRFDEEQYTMGDFKRAYFSLDGDYISKILSIDGNRVVYNVEEHEKLLYSSEKYRNTAARIIASTISVFDKACYSLEKDEHNNTIRKYNAYYQYGPEILYKNHPKFHNIKYDVGERIKMFIVDKYYADNYGFYQIEILSGINFDDSGTIEGKLKEVEYYFLGTPIPGSSEDRADGMIARIYKNLLDSGFATLVRVALALYVVLYGYRITFGFKKDKKVISMSALMVDLFKLVLIISLVSETGFQLFNRVVMNFVINGVVGFVDLISGIFGSGLVNNDNFIALSGGLIHSSDLPSFSKNFKIIDEVLALLKTDTILLKIFSLFYNTGFNFFLGIPVGMGVLVVIIMYIFKLAMVVVPFIFTLLQLTLTLPLAPLFILFNFFDFTKEYFENWLKFVLGKALEIFAFFLGFYFMTFILNNKIKELLNYKVCFYKMGNYIFGNGDDLNPLVKVIRDALNYALYMEKIGMPDNFFIYYLVNIFISLLLLGLFDSITKSIMSVISSIFVIDGASVGGGSSTLADFTATDGSGSSKFSLGNQFAQFNRATGLATIQSDSDALRWTKRFVDLNKTGMDNLKQTGENVFKGISAVPNAFIKTADERIEYKERIKNNPDNKEQMSGFGQMLKDNVREGIAKEVASYTEDAFGKDSIIDIHGRNFGKPIGWYKKYKEEGWKYKGDNKFLKAISKPVEWASNRKFEKHRDNKRNRSLDGRNDRYYREDILKNNEHNIIKDELKSNLLNLSDNSLEEKLKKMMKVDESSESDANSKHFGELDRSNISTDIESKTPKLEVNDELLDLNDEKFVKELKKVRSDVDENTVNKAIKLKSILNDIRSGKIRFGAGGQKPEDLSLGYRDLEKLKEYLDSKLIDDLLGIVKKETDETENGDKFDENVKPKSERHIFRRNKNKELDISTEEPGKIVEKNKIKTIKRIIKLKNILNGIRSGKIKFTVNGKSLEDLLLEDGTLDKINEYLKDENSEVNSNNKEHKEENGESREKDDIYTSKNYEKESVENENDKNEYKGEATDLFSEEAMELIDNKAFALFDSDGTSLVNNKSEDIIDVRIKKDKVKISVKNDDEEARKAMEEKIEKNKKMEEEYEKELKAKEEKKNKK